MARDAGRPCSADIRNFSAFKFRRSAKPTFDAVAADKVVTAICHGPWVLSDAGVLRGKRATDWWSIKPDLNAGATFVDEPEVTGGTIITSCAPIDLAAYVQAIDKLLTAG
jgi:protease I